MSFLEQVRSKLPVFKYTVKKTIKKKIDASTIFAALQEKLEGCVATPQADGSLEVRNIDPFGLSRGYRDVVMHVHLKSQMDNTTVIADVQQGWTKWFALVCVIAIPTLLVGIV